MSTVKYPKQSSEKISQGFSLVELLIVVTIIGFVFFFLIIAIDIGGIVSKTKNVVIRSTMNKLVLSIESFHSAYNKLPNEEDFISVLSHSTKTYEDSCVLLGLSDYECLFRNSSLILPNNCDISTWRDDSKRSPERIFSCNARYYAGDNLPSNNFSTRTQYRLYSPIWGSKFKYMIYDSLDGGIFYICPGTVTDSDILKDICEKM